MEVREENRKVEESLNALVLKNNISFTKATPQGQKNKKKKITLGFSFTAEQKRNWPACCSFFKIFF